MSMTATPSGVPEQGVSEVGVQGGVSGVPGQRASAPDDDVPRYAPQWLQLREPADAAARAPELLDPLRIRLANRPGRGGDLVIHDLGCGTGSMGRWLAPGSTAPSTGSCTTGTPICCISRPWAHRARPPTAAG